MPARADEKERWRSGRFLILLAAFAALVSVLLEGLARAAMGSLSGLTPQLMNLGFIAFLVRCVAAPAAIVGLVRRHDALALLVTVAVVICLLESLLVR